MSLTRRHTERKAGFTLIELMIAISVLVVAVVSTFVTQISANNLLRTARETTLAMSDLETAMERARLRHIDSLPLAASPFAAGVPVPEFTDLHLTNERLVTTYPGFVSGSDVPDPLSIVMTITWDDFRGRQRALRLAGMKTR